MGKRSPVLGFNHNFKHRGLVFHVQTEDSGVDNPHLFTHCFHGGVILSSRRMDYDADSEVDIVKSLMQSQHKAVLKDLKMGAFDDKIDAYLGGRDSLLPRKANSMATKREQEKGSAAQAVDPDMQTGTLRDLPPVGDGDIGTSATLASPVPLVVDDAADRTEAHPAPNFRSDTEPEPAPPQPAPPASPGVRLDLVKPPRERERIPTPIAIPVVSADNLGDPQVTFTSPVTPPPSDGVPRSRSKQTTGAYSKSGGQLPKDDLSGPRRRRATSVPAPAAAAQSGAVRPMGKAANPEKGRPSSVVVSRPAVIIGAPPKAVGKDRGRRPAARKARSGNVFGNMLGKDAVSEKSLDEVIMAYLSEDDD